MPKVRARCGGQIGFCVSSSGTDQVPTYSIRDSSPSEVTLRLASGWSVHLPATADGTAYLRGLAAVIAKCAEEVEESAAKVGPE